MDVHTLLLIAHLLGVCFGLGGTLILDFRLFRLVTGATIEPDDFLFARVLSRYVQLGLVLLWGSGVAFFALAPDGQASLQPARVRAKLVVIVALTLNGMLIGGLAVPLVSRNVGRPLFDGIGEAKRTILIASAVISSVSWVTPFVLGSIRVFDAPVSARQILEIYLAITGFALLLVQLGTASSISPRRSPPCRPQGDEPARSVLR